MAAKSLTKLLILLLCISSAAALAIVAQGSQSESQLYVHDYSSVSTGNWTYVEKPIFPLYFNNSQIGIGKNWSIVCPLVADHAYHVYCYGSWVSNATASKTDYDIYVFDPKGDLESEHTEAAGLPEHLGTTVNDALFVPKFSGNYTFLISNDAKESRGAQQATFMIIENAKTDEWLSHFAEGKLENGSVAFNTCWSYEFVTDEPYVELWINVPKTLDMYEARLFLMNDAKSPSINGFPLPWELGLYGNKSGSVGGYNFDSEGYRGVAVASCEYRGQAMFLNYTASTAGRHLYHLVFIGEVGSGNLDFLIKTKFGEAVLSPLNAPRRVYPLNTSEIVFASNLTNLEKADLIYSTDNWNSSDSVSMAISNRTCSATIPGQAAGVSVRYKVLASDLLRNRLSAEGNYTVKQGLSLNITINRKTIALGENVTVAGNLNPNGSRLPVYVYFSQGNNTEKVACTPLENGTVSASYAPETAGMWEIQAKIPESNTVYEVNSDYLTLMVEEPPFYVTYWIFIVGGVIGACAAAGAVYFLKFRNR